MNLSFTQKILLHSCSLFLSTVILVATQLSKVALVFALCLVVYNLKNIISSIINRDQEEKKIRIAESPIKKLAKNTHGRFDASEFQDRVRSAFLKNANKKCGYFEQDNKYWHNNYFCKSDKIEELKDVKLTDLRRDRIMKNQQSSGLKLEFSTSKKIRTFLETRQTEDKATIRKIKEWAELNFKNIGEPFSKIQLSDRQIELSLSLLQQYITSKISDDYESIINDFNAVDKVLQKCFSLSLSLQQGTNSIYSISISFADLKQMMKQIDRKDMLPHIYTTNLSLHQIKRELLQVRNKIEKLPDFSQPPNLLRLSLFMKHLRKEFQDLNISFFGFDREQLAKDGSNNHIFKYQDSNRLYYNKVTSIKSKTSSIPVFLFLMSIWKQYHRSNKSIIREVKSILIM